MMQMLLSLPAETARHDRGAVHTHKGQQHSFRVHLYKSDPQHCPTLHLSHWSVQVSSIILLQCYDSMLKTVFRSVIKIRDCEDTYC